MPVTILTALLTSILFVIGYVYEWWTLHNDILLPFGYVINVPFTYGGYIIATFWIFHLTSHNFWIYITTQLVVNGFWAFIGLRWIIDEWLEIATFEIKNWQFFLTEIVVILILYGYHHWQKTIYTPPDSIVE